MTDALLSRLSLSREVESMILSIDGDCVSEDRQKVNMCREEEMCLLAAMATSKVYVHDLVATVRSVAVRCCFLSERRDPVQQELKIVRWK